ncbi:hypothetical protein FRC04_005274 [Tulasnella sp. 424]|nr:hypothetical protein FRC04_005274 [Tulasnella sp. 424]
MSASFGDPPLSPAISDPFARHAPLGTSHGLQAYPESPAVGQRAPSGATDVLSPSFDASDSPGRIFSPPTAGLSQLSHQTWPLNIPPPDLLHHLVETFFASVPFAARLIHRPTFMTNLQQIPTSPDFPHVSLLHAICAIASLYSPVIRDPPAKNFDPTNGATASFDSAILYRKYENVRMNQYFPRRLEDVMGEDDNSFGESHVKWCGATLRMATQRGDRLIQLLEAAIIGCWYSYTTGRSTFSWIGIVSRMTLPLGLSASPGYEPLSRLPPHILSLLQEAKNPVEVELHRNLYWLAYSLERVYTAATVWPLTISDDDVSQMMPCRLNDFNSGVYVPIQGRQHLFTHKMLTTHPVLTTDSFTLYLKGSVLLGKVKTFNIRFKMRYTDGGGPTSMGGSVYTAAPLDQDQSQPSPEYLYGAPSSTASSKVDARETAEFQVLDNLIRSFISSIPKEFKDPVPTELEVKLDPVLYTAHLLPHV